jgi:nicotinamide-nucleotide amidase
MNAALVAVGSELLRFGRRDTNGDWLGERLQRVGVEIVARAVVEDDADRIASAVRAASAQADLVIVGGGLGPTEDDRTREGLSRALEVPLERDEEQVERLKLRFEERGFRFGPNQARQAERPRGALWLENPIGSAPGIDGRIGQARLIALPGVPAEFRAIAQASLLASLASREATLVSRTLKIVGRTESSVDEQVSDLYDEPGTSVTVLTGREGIELHIRAWGESRDLARGRLDQVDRKMAARLGRDLYGRDDETLAHAIAAALLPEQRTVAVAESCTGGLLATTLTALPGASAWFKGGCVVYSDALKRDLVGVPEGMLREHGAVSEPVARELAKGARQRCGATFGIGLTGIAGPGGGTKEKPVGLVHLAIAGPDASEHARLTLIGDRQLIRRRSVTATLDRLRRRVADTRGGS